MRRFGGVLFFLFVLLSGFGKTITVDDARIVAVNWLNSNSYEAFCDESIKQVFTQSNNNEPLVYIVVFQPYGWVMIAGSDLAEPVLGYSSNSIFDPNNIPVQMQEWMDGFASEIEAADKQVLPHSQFLNEKWVKLKSTEETLIPLKGAMLSSVGPLLTSEWNQGRYYNEMAPADSKSGAGNGHVWIGCVATAMAQVMKYWEYPVNGSDNHSYNHSKYGAQTADFENANYNWSEIPNKSTSVNIEVQKINYHAAVSVNMDFGPYSSGAFLEDALVAFSKYFKYNTTITHAYKNNWDSETEWKLNIKNELNSGRPVVYAGYSPAGNSGHAFVCDGYSNDYFHFNWGWGGASNGNFLLSALTPGSSNYTNNQAALFGLEPIFNKAIPTVYNEGFEMGNEGHFSVFSNAKITSDDKHSGNYSLRLSDPGFSSKSLNCASLAFLVPADCRLSFWVKRSTPEVSTKNIQKALLMPLYGETVLKEFYNGGYNDADWVNYTFDLDEYAGQIVRLQFIQQNFDLVKKQWHYIDNISITGINQNFPPFEPSSPIPQNNQLKVAHAPLLKWSGGDINGDVVSYDVFFGKTNQPKFIATTSANSFQLPVLEHSTSYFWKVVSTDGEYEAESPLWSFATMGIPPVVDINANPEVYSDKAKIYGNIINSNGAEIYSRGFCWNTKGEPTIYDQFIESTETSDRFSAMAKGLNPFTKYYVRAYANSDQGDAYSDQLSFTTLSGLSEVNAMEVLNVFRTKATLKGTLLALNDSVNLKFGVVWSQKAAFEPVTARVVERPGALNSGQLFEITVENLPGPDTIYYRMFADNSVGRAYSDENWFVLTNTPPVISLDADNSSKAINGNFLGEVYEQMPGGFIADSDVQIIDIDSDTIQMVKLVISNQQVHPLEYLRYIGNTDSVLVTGSYSDTLTLIKNSDFDNRYWEYVFRNVEYFIDSDDPDITKYRQVEVQVSDGFQESNKAIARLKVYGVNDAPVCLKAPSINIQPVFGKTIAVVEGTWADTLDNCTYEWPRSYQWQLKTDDSVLNLENQTSANFEVTEVFCGAEIRVVETIIDHNCGGKNEVTAYAESDWYTVNKAQQAINFDLIPVQYFHQKYYVLSGQSSMGLPLIYSTSANNLIGINADTIFFLTAGKAAISAVNEGDECISSSDKAFRILTIEKGEQQIVSHISPIIPFTFDLVEPDIEVSSLLDVVIESSDTLVVSIVDGMLKTNGVGKAQLRISQLGNSNFNPASDLLIPITVEKGIQQMVVPESLVCNYIDRSFNLDIFSHASIPFDFEVEDKTIAEYTDGQFLIKGAGETFIRIFNEGNNNWNAVENRVRLVVYKGVQSITFDGLSAMAYRDTSLHLIASAESMLPVHFETDDATVARVVNQSFLKIVGAGIVNISATQIGNSNWGAAEPVVQQLKIDKIDQHIYTSLPDTLIEGEVFELENFKCSSGLTLDELTSSDENIVQIKGRILYVLEKGTITLTANQWGNKNYNPVSDKFSFIVDAVDTLVTWSESESHYCKVYPNPASGEVTVSFTKGVKLPSQIEILNQAGQIVQTIKDVGSTNKIDLFTLSSGVYFVVVKTQQGVICEKLIVL
ncbi:MAG TPA: thiol protease/hemagglutinin PrtT [Prolixibacteraceae bacterium]|nr:thiol protease/hemagglutinin PrtT [Prolixibacteraceae bacterium]